MDIEKAKSALVNAHNAGDVESARKIANYIKAQSGQQAQEYGALQKGVDLAASAAKGATFGMGPKGAAAIGAGIAKPVLEGVELVTGREAPSYMDLYKRGFEMYSEPSKRAEENAPIMSLGAELAGGITSGIGAAGTAPARALGALARRGGTVGRVGAGAVAGESSQRVYEAGEAPVGGEAEILGKKGVSLGGVLGGAIPALGAVGRAVAPKVDEGLRATAQLAKKYNIPLSVDQIAGGRAVKNLQKVSQELPFSGQEGFRDKQMSAFNRALLKTVGVEGDKVTRLNIDKAFINVGKKFDNFGAGKTFEAQPLLNAVKEISEEAPSFATQDAQKTLSFNVSKLLKNIDNDKIAGEKLNQLRIQVNRASRKAKDADTVDLLKDLENAIVETLSSGDEAAMRQAKNQYKNLLVLEPLAAKAKGGDISPTQLTNRVNRIYGRQFVRGKAGEIGELADVGRELLPELGGSDTAQKALLAGSIVGGAVNPSTLLVTGGAMAVNRALQSGVNRNQAIINAMTREARDELLALPPAKAQQVLDSISTNLGLTSGVLGN